MGDPFIDVAHLGTEATFMRNAVLAELGAQRAAAREESVVVRDGLRVGGTARSSVFKFKLDNSFEVSDGSPVVLTVGEAVVEGELLGQRTGEATVRLEGLAAAWVPHGTLVADATFLLRRLHQFLEPSYNRPPHFDPSAANLLFAPARLTSSTLQLGQAQAVSMAQSRRVGYLWGPPGTGKTQTVAAAVLDWARAGLRVLVVSHTNVAVDTVTARCVQALQPCDAWASDGGIVRVGDLVRADIPAEVAGRVQVDEILAARGHTEARERVRLRARLDGLLKEYRKVSAAPRGESWLADEVTKASEELDALDARLKHLRHTVVDAARVLTCTVHRLYIGDWIHSNFDAVVIEEASMIPTPLAWVAAGLARRHVLIAGDFRQLPPVVRSDQPQVLEWYGRDAFEVGGVVAAVRRNSGRADLVALDLQYRMHAEIADLVSDSFYRPLHLRTAPTVLQRGCLAQTPAGRPLALVDLSGLATWCARPGGLANSGRYNLLSAQLGYLVDALARQDAQVAGGEGVVAIAPYRAQGRLLAAADRDAASARQEDPAIVATVHRFQGNESHTVLLDLVDAQRLPTGRFYRPDPLDSASRLLNVAISRAQQHLIVLADVDAILSSDPPESVARMLRSLRGQANVLTPDALAEHAGLPAWIARSAEASARVLELIRTATSSVTIHSSGVGRAGLAAILPELLAAAARNVSVHLVLPAVGARGGDRVAWTHLLDHLEAANIAIDQQAHVAEDLALVDDWCVGATHPLLLEAPDQVGATRQLVVATRTPELISVVKQLHKRRPLKNQQPLLEGRIVPICDTCQRPQTRHEAWGTKPGAPPRLNHWATCDACDIPRPAQGSNWRTLVDDALRSTVWDNAGKPESTGRREAKVERAWARASAATANKTDDFQCSRCFLIHPASFRSAGSALICQDCN
ncbi:hypothetical protein GCM10009657_18850 [Oryzihumus leptocrescens]